MTPVQIEKKKKNRNKNKNDKKVKKRQPKNVQKRLINDHSQFSIKQQPSRI